MVPGAGRAAGVTVRRDADGTNGDAHMADRTRRVWRVGAWPAMGTSAMLTMGLLAMSMQADAQTTATQAGAMPPAAQPCGTAQYRQFDFWLGEWEVSKPDGSPAGHSRIEAILGGCVILEHWTSAKPPYAGKSFNTYNSATGQWEQFWVDNGGARLHLLGGLVDGRMVLAGVQDKPDPKTGIVQRERITWSVETDGSVRQLWETSTDDGKSWVVSFDGRYRHPRG